jgi:uncharacterized protein (TIGR02453 family)
MNIQYLLGFLSELSENNNREWFAQNKERYDTCKEYFEKISKELILQISAFDDEIKHVEAKDCIFRIYRDTRFSHDKTPYKTHFGVFIAAAGGRKSQKAGYYLHIDPAGSFIGSGVWCPPPPLLKALRQCVYDNIDEFVEITDQKNFNSYFPKLYDEDKLKTVPTGFPKDFSHAEWLKVKHYLVEYRLNKDILESEDFITKVAGIFKTAYPFNRFLNYTVDEQTNN